MSCQPDNKIFSNQKRIILSIGVLVAIRSEEVAVRHSAEDADKNSRKHKGAEQTLKEDGVLDLAKGRLLNPDFAIEDAADDVALGILGHPGLVFERVGARADEGIVRSGLFVGEGNFVSGVGEQLPGPQVAVVHMRLRQLM